MAEAPVQWMTDKNIKAVVKDSKEEVERLFQGNFGHMKLALAMKYC